MSIKIQQQLVKLGLGIAKAAAPLATKMTQGAEKLANLNLRRDSFDTSAVISKGGDKIAEALQSFFKALGDVISMLKGMFNGGNVGVADKASGSVVNNPTDTPAYTSSTGASGTTNTGGASSATSTQETSTQSTTQTVTQNTTTNTGSVGGTSTSTVTANPVTKAGGTANAADVALVNAELAKIPEKYRQMLVDNNAQVVVVRNGVTEHYTDLKGVQPRGWPPGSSWDQVTGAALGKEAVIAVVGHSSGYPRLDHGGSSNVVLHEVGHVLHNIAEGFSADFIKARNADMGSLSAYEKQADAAGLQETFAESFSRAFTDPNYRYTHPNLYAYWQSMPDLK